MCLGLADVIGEYRRLALDNLREGEVKKAEECLEIMDQIFIQLLALDEAYMLVPGLRHKSDSDRRIIEATRGDVTLEIRRKSLEDALKKYAPRVKLSELSASLERSTIDATPAINEQFHSSESPPNSTAPIEKNNQRK